MKNGNIHNNKVVLSFSRSLGMLYDMVSFVEKTQVEQMDVAVYIPHLGVVIPGFLWWLPLGGPM